MRYTAIDLFAGAGGATQGLTAAGFEVLGAVENDRAAATTFRQNHSGVNLWESDIRRVPATHVLRELSLTKGELTLLKSCPPCQGFSSLAEGRAVLNPAQNDLVLHTARFVRALRPEAVLVENVPGLGRDHRSKRLFKSFRDLGYAARSYGIDAAMFGVPQRRKRFIILAVRGSEKVLPERLGSPEEPVETATVGAAFAELARTAVPNDVLSRQRPLNDLLRERIKAIPPGGSRFDLPDHLRLDCHVKLGGTRNASGSYGRMKLDEPSPTITTRCTTPSCGSFIHPTEDRPITLREAATLQTFPPSYVFSGNYGEIERQIGNAVPVRMAQALGAAVMRVIS